MSTGKRALLLSLDEETRNRVETELEGTSIDLADSVPRANELLESEAFDILLVSGELADSAAELRHKGETPVFALTRGDEEPPHTEPYDGTVGLDSVRGVEEIVEGRLSGPGGDATEVTDRERSLLRLNGLLARAESKEEIEEGVCDVLSDLYSLAWIGEDGDPKAYAGTDQGYLERMEGFTPGDTGAGGVEVVNDVEGAESLEDWRREALAKRGFDSVATVPLDHRDRSYGTLRIYSDGAADFEGETEMLEAVGGNVAQAIDSIESANRLEETTSRLDTVLNTVPDPVVVADAVTGELVEVNEAAERLFGRGREELIGSNQVGLHPSGEEERYRSLFERHKEEAPVSIDRMEDGDWVYVEDADGQEIPVEINADETRLDGEPAFLGVFRDIRHRVGRQEVLHDLYEATKDMILAMDEREVAEIGVEAAREVLDQRYAAIWFYDDAEKVLKPVTDTAEAQDLLGPQPEIEKDGGLAWNVFKQGEPQLFQRLNQNDSALNPETPLESELIIPLGRYGVLTVSFTDEEDVDPETRACAKLLASNIEEALSLINNREKSRELTVLNRVTRHDILNDINLVYAWTQELERRAGEEGEELLKKIRETSHHVLEITQNTKDMVQLLENGRGLELEPVELSSILEDVVENGRNHFPEADIRLKGAPEGTEVLAGDLVDTVFRNLVNNAVQHNDKGEPQVSVEVEEGEESVTVSVVDNGPGIPESRREEVFGRGEKGLESSGTGVGLYLVDTLIDEYGGTIEVEEREQEGTVFHVTLDRDPLVQELPR